MTLGDSLVVSLIGFAVVFIVLILLSVLIQFQSLVLGYVTRPKSKASGQGTVLPQVPVPADKGVTARADALDAGWSAGELKLIGVDEKTAAMIMAIVSHESQIPLSELEFKMIKAME
ncbi:MAG: OadG family protein [Syntrophomonadaceae bacterium]|jgi:Na+-transporting methylmalonyl-CoA/oxaloacetate decarboxylase gamma subunit|nr:OadG family protein [Syntrophomonadaceae bacterium]